MLKRIVPVFTVGLALAGLLLTNTAYAHDFSSNESSSFLALVESIKVELELAQSNYASNSTIALEHAAHAHEHLDEDIIEEIAERNQRLSRDLPAALEELHLSIGNSSATEVQSMVQNINDLLDETVSVRIDSEQLSNATTQAVFVASLVDGALEHYKIAHGLGSNANGHGSNETHDSHGNEEPEMSMDNGHNNTDNPQNRTIVDVVSYQTAQGLADRALQVFDGTVAELALVNSTENVAEIKDGLRMLNQSIASMASPDKIEVIVHGTVHPNLQEAYNLQVIPEFPSPVLIGIAALAGSIIVARLRNLFGRSP